MKIASPGFTQDAVKILSDRQWPGNVRELANTIQKALIFNRGNPLEADDIHPITDEDYIRDSKTDRDIDGLELDTALRQWIRMKMTEGAKENIYDNLMDFFSALLIREALNITEGNRTHGARLLGISRPTLIAKIEKHGLKFQTTVSED
jgi:DNA-binding NtrC family response regulator